MYVRKSIDSYLKSIMHDNEDYIRDNYDSFAAYIIDKAINNNKPSDNFRDYSIFQEEPYYRTVIDTRRREKEA